MATYLKPFVVLALIVLLALLAVPVGIGSAQTTEPTGIEAAGEILNEQEPVNLTVGTIPPFTHTQYLLPVLNEFRWIRDDEND